MYRSSRRLNRSGLTKLEQKPTEFTETDRNREPHRTTRTKTNYFTARNAKSPKKDRTFVSAISAFYAVNPFWSPRSLR
jgi:hypothetical protein